MRGATCVSMARAGAIQSTVPSATSPATRNRRGASADTSTGTVCATRAIRPSLWTVQSSPSKSIASPRNSAVTIRTYSSVLRPGWSYDIP